MNQVRGMLWGGMRVGHGIGGYGPVRQASGGVHGRARCEPGVRLGGGRGWGMRVGQGTHKVMVECGRPVMVYGGAPVVNQVRGLVEGLGLVGGMELVGGMGPGDECGTGDTQGNGAVR